MLITGRTTMLVKTKCSAALEDDEQLGLWFCAWGETFKNVDSWPYCCCDFSLCFNIHSMYNLKLTENHWSTLFPICLKMKNSIWHHNRSARDTYNAFIFFLLQKKLWDNTVLTVTSWELFLPWGSCHSRTSLQSPGSRHPRSSSTHCRAYLSLHWLPLQCGESHSHYTPADTHTHTDIIP